MKFFKSSWPILLILALILIYFWPNFFWPGVSITPTVGTNDFTDNFYPIRDFSVRALRGGYLPVWFSAVSGGYPILAGGGVFYPLKFLFLFLPTMLSVNLTIFGTYFLLGVAAYFYFRQINLSKMASFFGAINMTFCGFAVHELMHLEAIASLTYLLFELICWEKFLAGKKYLYLVFGGLAFGLQLLGGHFQFTFYGFLFLGAYLLFLKILRRESWLKLISGGFIFIFLGLLIGAVQILPTIESTAVSSRAGGLSAEVVTRFNFPIKSLITFLSPYADFDSRHTMEAFAHNGWPAEERYGYVGLIALALAVWAVISQIKSKPKVIFFSLTTVFFLFLAFGNGTFLGFILTLPIFNFFRCPTHFLMLVDLSLVCLATIGFERMTEKLKGKWPKSEKIFPFIFIGIVLLSFFDLYFWGSKLFPAVPAKKWLAEPEVVSFLKKNLALGERVTNEYYFYPSTKIFLTRPDLWHDYQTFINLRNLLPPFDSVMYDIPVSIGASIAGGLKVARFDELEAEIAFGGIHYQNLAITGFSHNYFTLSRLLGTKYLIFSTKVDRPEIKLVYQTNFQNGQDQVFVYELKDPLPRAFLVGKTKVLDPEKIKEKLLSDSSFNPQETLFLEEKVDFAGEKLSTAQAKIKKYDDQLVTIETVSDKDAFLFLSDVFYPGWKAFVDGKEIKIYRGNYAFRAVPVKAGNREVVFRYLPQTLTWGLRISLLGFLLTFGLLIAFGYKESCFEKEK